MEQVSERFNQMEKSYVGFLLDLNVQNQLKPFEQALWNCFNNLDFPFSQKNSVWHFSNFKT